MPSVFAYLFFLFLLLYTQFIFPVWARKKALQADASDCGIAPRLNSYLRTIVVLGCQAGVALLIGIPNHLQIFGSNRYEPKILLWAIGFVILNIGLIDPAEWRYTSVGVKNSVIAFLPHTVRERLIWVLVSLATAVSEEIVYRAVFFGILYRLTGDYWVAATVSAVAFGFNHRGYGLMSVGSTFFVGLVLQWFVHISGGLHIAIAIHFIHNFFALVYAIGERQGMEGQRQHGTFLPIQHGKQ